MRLHHWFTAAVLVALSVAVQDLHGANDGRAVRILRASDRDRAFVTQPGGSLTLTILALNADGAGVPGVTLNFAAPLDGPSGTFPASATPTQTYISVETDSNGVASATLVTSNIPGHFSVGASVAGGNATTSFAVTNTPDLPQTALEPQAVRDAVNEQLYDGVASTEWFQLHGPFFVPAGYVIRGFSRDHTARQGPVAVERDSWLLWADFAPMAQFAHEAHWVLVDAVDATGYESAVTHNVRWWPIVEDPETGDGDSLYNMAWAHPEAEQLDSEGNPIDTGDTAAAGGSRFHPRTADAQTPCAILMHGPNTPPADVLKYEKYLLNSGQVVKENIFKNTDAGGIPRPVSTADIDKLIEAAKMRGCDKVFLLFATHGGEDSEGGGLATRGQLIGHKEKFGILNFPVHAHVKLSYEQFVVKLQRLGKIQLCILQSSCFSGQMLDWIQGRGFTGSIVSSTYNSTVGWVMPWGGVVVDLFLRAKTTAKRLADGDGDGEVTDFEAMDWVRDQQFVRNLPNGGTIDWVAEALPQVDAIQADFPRRISVPNIYINLGQSVEVTIRRPFSSTGDMTGGLRVFDPSIAAPKWGASDKLSDRREGVKKFTIDSSKKKIWFEGKMCGTTLYEVRLFVGDQEYTAKAVIQVGHFKVSPMKIRMPTNSTRAFTLDFFGKSFNGPEPLHSAQIIKAREVDGTIKTDKEEIAKPSLTTFKKPADQQQLTVLAISGANTGTAKFTVSENKEFSKKVIEVQVYKPGSTRVGLNDACPKVRSFYQYAAKIRRINDKYGHSGPVGSWNAVKGSIWLENGQMGITGDIPQWAPAMGEIDCNTRRYILNGNSGATRIAGFGNVPAVYTGMLPGGSTVGSSGLTKRAIDLPGLDIVYELGEGVFPNGPIVYELDGTVDVDDVPCEYSLEPAELTRSFPAGAGSVSLTTGLGCAWTASSDQPWLTLAEQTSTAGAIVLEFTYEENPGDTPRTATVTAGGEAFTFTQEGTAATRPVIATAGVVNGTSFDRGVAPGTWLTIQGWNLAATTRTWGEADFLGSNLPTALDGVRVTINGIPAYIYFISPLQLNLLAADGLSPGFAEVVVTTPAGISDARTVSILSVDPGLFQFDPDGRAYAAAVHADGTFVGREDLFGGAVSARPALAEEDVLFFGSGFGLTTPVTPTGRLVAVPAPLARPVVFLIGGQVSLVKFAGVISSGLIQFNVVIPDGLDPGDHEVEVFLDGIPIQDGVLITIGE